jgi:hypothetical protein
MTGRRIIIFVFALMVSTYSATAQSVKETCKYRLLTYGLQDDKRLNASRIIQSKWKIEIYPVAGCVVGSELEDSVKRENDKVYKLIEKDYGKDWEAKFDLEVEGEYQLEMKVDSIVRILPYIMNKEIINPLPGSPFPMRPVGVSGNYLVTVSTYNIEWQEQKLYRLRVNHKDSSVEILEDYTKRP